MYYHTVYYIFLIIVCVLNTIFFTVYYILYLLQVLPARAPRYAITTWYYNADERRSAVETAGILFFLKYMYKDFFFTTMLTSNGAQTDCR